MKRVCVQNEWDPLEEIIVGRIEGAQLAAHDATFKNIEFPEWPADKPLPFQAYPDQVIEETLEDLEILCNCLIKLGVDVHRPRLSAHDKLNTTPGWAADGAYNLSLIHI